MKRSVAVILFGAHLFLSYSPYAVANAARCTEPVWKTLDMNGDNLVANVERTCTLTTEDHGTLTAYKDSYVKARIGQATQVYDVVTWDKGMRFDLSEKAQTNEGLLVMRTSTDVLMPDAATYSMWSRTREVTGTGNARYTRALENRVHIKFKGNKTYEVVIGTQAIIAKPTFAPKSLLKREVQKRMQQEIFGMSERLNKELFSAL